MTWYGEVLQDKFAYEQSGRKTNGTFIDIGCWQPVICNNSYALEQLGWRGVLVDLDPMYTDWCRRVRPHAPIFTAHAETVDWKLIAETHDLGPVVDYLSVDIEGSELDVLHKLADAGLIFRAITIEHNLYSKGAGPRDAQRDFLYSQGYKLFAPDVPNSTGLIFEDWWTL